MPASSTAPGLLLRPWAACPALDTFGQKVQSVRYSDHSCIFVGISRTTGVGAGYTGKAPDEYVCPIFDAFGQGLRMDVTSV